MSRLLLALGVAVALVATAVPGMADTIDLTTAGSSGTINGAIFEQLTFGESSGTGVFDAFLRYGEHPVGAGVNTQGSLLYDTQNSPRDVVSYTVTPLVTLNSVQYRQFIFDINEVGEGNSHYLSLDRVQVWISDSATLTAHTVGSMTGATLIYDLDTGNSANEVLLNSALSGSGDGRYDMAMYIQESLFDGTKPYVYIYSESGGKGVFMGLDFGDTDGKQEWGYLIESDQQMEPVPEPTTLLLLGAGIGGLAARRRRQRMRAG